MEDVQINGNFKFQTIDFIIIAYIYPQNAIDLVNAKEYFLKISESRMKL